MALLASALAWAGLIAATTSQTGSQLYATTMSAGSAPGSTLLFLVAWEVMVIAMMLPSSLNFLILFQKLTSQGPLPRARRILLHIGFGSVWAAVGCATIVVNATLYRFQGAGIWLEGHPGILAGSVLILAGAFQFTALKHRCLQLCSRPESFLMRHYRRGLRSACVLGIRYGLLCLGCCWALMTLMVVLGDGSIHLMLLLSMIMFAERALAWDDKLTKTIGLTCIALGVLAVASPAAIPALAQNAERWVAMGSTHLSNHGLLFWCHA